MSYQFWPSRKRRVSRYLLGVVFMALGIIITAMWAVSTVPHDVRQGPVNDWEAACMAADLTAAARQRLGCK